MIFKKNVIAILLLLLLLSCKIVNLYIIIGEELIRLGFDLRII